MPNDQPDWTNPNIFTSVLLYGVLNLAPGAHHDLSIGQYSSIVVVMNSASATSQVVQLEFHQTSVVGGPGDTVPFSEYLTSWDPTGASTWVIPVNAGSVRITNTAAAGGVNMVVYGSNREVNRMIAVGETDLPRQLAHTGTWSNGGAVMLTNNDGLNDYTHLNYNVTYYLTNLATVAIFFIMSYINTSGTEIRVTIDSCPANGNVHGTVTCPPGCTVRWIAQGQGADAVNHQFIATLIES